jgi:hypothetical protein
VDSAWLEGPPRDRIAAAKQVVIERPSGTRGHAFFNFMLPRSDAPDVAMAQRAEVMLGSDVIYEGEQDDHAYKTWHRDAMKTMEPFTVGQYWGDSDQTQREVKTLADDAWARIQLIRAERDPSACLSTTSPVPAAFTTSTAGRRSDD